MTPTIEIHEDIGCILLIKEGVVTEYTVRDKKREALLDEYASKAMEMELTISKLTEQLEGIKHANR